VKNNYSRQTFEVSLEYSLLSVENELSSVAYLKVIVNLFYLVREFHLQSLKFKGKRSFAF